MVLTTIKYLLNIEQNATHFDNEIIVHINAALSRLADMGIVESGTIIDNTTMWTSIIGTSTEIEAVKEFIYLDVKLVFDPPASSSVQQAFAARRDEMLHTLSWKVDTSSNA